MDDIYLQELVREEGFKLLVYDDATGAPIVPGYTLVGYPTIGYGRELSRRGITPRSAQYLLENDVHEIEAALAIYPWWTSLTGPRQFVIVSMAFNMGLTGMLRFQKMIAALKVRDFAAAAAEMLNSGWAKQLPTRSQRLAAIMRTGRM